MLRSQAQLHKDAQLEWRRRNLRDQRNRIIAQYDELEPDDPETLPGRRRLMLARNKVTARLSKIDEDERLGDTRYPAHAFADLFPLMPEARFKELCESIKKTGLLDPIVIHGGQMLDGRNRERACKAVGVEPRYVEFGSLGRDCTPEEFILTRNLKRRDLTPDQRAAIAVEGEERLRAEARERQRRAGGDKRSPESRRRIASVRSATSGRRAPTVREMLAITAGISQRKITAAHNVRTHRPELLLGVRDGKITLGEAFKQTPAAPESSKRLHYKRAVKLAIRAIDNYLDRTRQKLEFLEQLESYVSGRLERHKRDAARKAGSAQDGKDWEPE